jgi:AraC-like DNA-binding protein
MDDIDALIRGATIGIILVSTIVFLRIWPNKSLGRMWMLYALAIAGYVLWPHSATAAWPPLVRLFVAVLALSAPFFFWAVSRMVFEDGFSLHPAHWALLGVVITAGLAQGAIARNGGPFWLSESLRIGFRLISLGLIFHIFWLVWKGRSGDLVEKRMQLRIGFLLGTGVLSAFLLVTAILYAAAPDWPGPVRLFQAVVLLLFNLGYAVSLTHVDRDFFPPDAAPAPPRQITLNSDAAGLVTDAKPETRSETRSEVRSDPDADLLARLEKLMQHQEAWRETGLAIGDLASRLSVPEYRLRRLINQQMGFRNFTAFVNDYRLSAAALRLADRGQIHIPVLTIALELGWGSIGPFNRAFRTRFGMTPTDYRREQTTSDGPVPCSLADSREKSTEFRIGNSGMDNSKR